MINVKRLAMLFVSAGYSFEELDDVAYYLERPDVRRKLFKEIERYKGDLKSESVDISSAVQKKAGEYSLKGDASTKVVELLVRESGLTVKECFILMERMLKEVFPGRHVPHPNSKMGMAAWLRSLSKEYSDSELLHVASRLRNQVVHGMSRPDDWVLKE